MKELTVPIFIRVEEDALHCSNPFKEDKKKFNGCHASNLNCVDGRTTGCNAFGMKLRWDESAGAYLRCEDCLREAKEYVEKEDEVDELLDAMEES